MSSAANWAAVRIGDVCSVGDGAHAKIPRAESGVRYLMAKNFKEGGLQLDSVEYISRDNFTRFFRENSYIPTVPRRGDVLVSIIGTLGEPYVVRPDDEFALSSSVAILRPDTTHVLSGYLYYWMRAPQFQDSVFGIKGGVAQSYVSLGMIKSLPLLCPSIEVQSKILAILSAYDDLIENNNRRIRILEEMAQRIYREWFVDFRYPGHQGVAVVDSELGPIPQGWSWGSLSDLVDDVRRTVDPRTVDPDTPYFGLEHLPEHSIAISDWGRAADVGSSKLRFEVGDILFGKIRPYFHKVGPPPVAGVCSTDAIVMRPREEAVGALALAVVSSDAFVTYAVQTSQGTKMPRANWKVLQEYPIPCPDGTLLRKYAGLMNDTVVLLHNLVMSVRNSQDARDLLLPRLTSGEIDVEDLDIAMPDVAA